VGEVSAATVGVGVGVWSVTSDVGVVVGVFVTINSPVGVGVGMPGDVGVGVGIPADVGVGVGNGRVGVGVGVACVAGKSSASPGLVTNSALPGAGSPSDQVPCGSCSSSPLVKPSPSESCIARDGLQNGAVLKGSSSSSTDSPKGVKSPPPSGLI